MQAVRSVIINEREEKKIISHIQKGLKIKSRKTKGSLTANTASDHVRKIYIMSYVC